MWGKTAVMTAVSAAAGPVCRDRVATTAGSASRPVRANRSVQENNAVPMVVADRVEAVWLEPAAITRAIAWTQAPVFRNVARAPASRNAVPMDVVPSVASALKDKVVTTMDSV